MKFNLVILALFAIACSSKPKVQNFPESADAKEEISNFQFALQNSSDQDYDLLAPESIKEARSSLKEAQKMEKDGKSNKKVLKEVAQGDAYLDQAAKNATDSRAKLQEVLLARDAALKAGASQLLPAELANLDESVSEQTSRREKKKDDEIKDKKADWVVGYQNLELAAIKKKNIGESKFLIDKSIQNGARELTPKTLTEANKNYEAADQYITKNRNDEAGIRAMALTSIASARKLDSTLATAKGLKAASPEETALRMRTEEENLNRTQGELADERGAAAALAASNAAMGREQSLNAIYEEARSKFTKDEAEVYKQGKNLVIRLRSLQFPKSQAVLKGEDFALLKKVEDVIGSFDKTAVVVEGHTDSTGDKAVNQKLSDERAEAVKQYLKANSTDSLAEIEAQGFGYERPLASNKTPEGRAQNRRVDVIIQPAQI